jgi:hypothetical protein
LVISKQYKTPPSALRELILTGLLGEKKEDLQLLMSPSSTITKPST